MEPWIINGKAVFPLGFGAGPLGDTNLPEESAKGLLDSIASGPGNFYDTARSYGNSEVRLGEYTDQTPSLICTKVGYGVPGVEDWSFDSVRIGAEEARNKLKRPVLDILLLHSCSRNELEKGEALRALHAEKQNGSARLVGYSGDNENLMFAIQHGTLDVIMTSINITDQYVLKEILPEARKRGVRVIAKRPLSNSPWRFKEDPVGNYALEYFRRWKALELNLEETGCTTWAELFLRFSLSQSDVVVAGTTKPEHWKELLSHAEKGPLNPATVENLILRFNEKNPGWWKGET